MQTEKLISQRHWRFNREKHAEKVKDTTIITVPDESMSLKYILERHTSGIATAAEYKEPRWDPGADFDSEDLEKLEHLDPFDRDEVITIIAKKTEELKASVKKAEDDYRAAAAAEKAEFEELKRELKAKKNKASEGSAKESDNEAKPK